MTMLTDEMIDAARPLFLALECGAKTITQVRQHLLDSGCAVDTLPLWVRNAPDGMHLTKAGKAIIVWHLMNAACRAQADAQPAAWQYRSHGSGHWMTTTKEVHDDYRDRGITECRELFIHPAAPALPEEPTVAMLEAIIGKPWPMCGNGMQDDALHYLRMGRENLALRNGLHNIDFDNAERILIGASAATVAELSGPTVNDALEGESK
ncbi:hypothetical protein ACI2VH_02670 [Ralstonia nicotianae]